MSRNVPSTFSLNPSPIDVLENWCHQRLGGGGGKNNRQGGSMATLWAGTSPASGHQEQRQIEGTSVENVPDPILTMNHFLWGVGRAWHWIGKIGDQSSYPQSSTEQAYCKYGNQSRDPSKVVISGADNCNCQALAATPLIIETAGRIGPRLT